MRRRSGSREKINNINSNNKFNKKIKLLIQKTKTMRIITELHQTLNNKTIDIRKKN